MQLKNQVSKFRIDKTIAPNMFNAFVFAQLPVGRFHSRSSYISYLKHEQKPQAAQLFKQYSGCLNYSLITTSGLFLNLCRKLQVLQKAQHNQYKSLNR